MASGDFENIPHLVWDRVYFGYWIESLEERWEERKKRWERFVEEDSEEELEGHSDEDRKGFAEEAYLYSEEIKVRHVDGHHNPNPDPCCRYLVIQHIKPTCSLLS